LTHENAPEFRRAYGKPTLTGVSVYLLENKRIDEI